MHSCCLMASRVTRPAFAQLLASHNLLGVSKCLCTNYEGRWREPAKVWAPAGLGLEATGIIACL